MKKLAKEQTEELNQLALLPDDAIDTTNIPEQTNWEGAVVGRFYPRHKSKTSVEIDSDILAWFKPQSSHDYHRIINKALLIT